MEIDHPPPGEAATFAVYADYECDAPACKVRRTFIWVSLVFDTYSTGCVGRVMLRPPRSATGTAMKRTQTHVQQGMTPAVYHTVSWFFPTRIVDRPVAELACTEPAEASKHGHCPRHKNLHNLCALCVLWFIVECRNEIESRHPAFVGSPFVLRHADQRLDRRMLLQWDSKRKDTAFP